MKNSTQLKMLNLFLSNKYIIWILNFIKYASLICIIPPIINYAAINREISAISSHGLPYDVGYGQKIFLSCKGKGVPSIVMDSPIGMNSDIWLPLQEKLSKLTKVCVYDRAGLGMSERPVETLDDKNATTTKAKIRRGQVFTIERMVEDLRRLITTVSEQERPLMFVGSELGSLIARFYTQIYSQDVSHIVMINPLVENLFHVEDKIWNDYWYTHIIPKWYAYSLGSAVGINRILLMTGLIKPQLHSNDLNEEISNRQKHLMCNPRHLFSMVDEMTYLNETLAQMKLIWTIKQFPQNVSITILKSKSDDLFALKNLEYNLIDHKSEIKKLEQLREAYKKSLDFLENNLHPNALKVNLDESLYDQLISKKGSQTNYLYNLIENLIMKWRKNNINTKSS